MLLQLKKVLLLFLFLLFGLSQYYLSAQSVGILYGLSYRGGVGGGTLFSYDPLTGKDTALIALTTNTGYLPSGSLMQASDGLLYGVTSGGGTNGDGTLFSYNTSTGGLAVLYSFAANTGSAPNGTLMQALDGKLYGMTTYGGTHNDGTLFSYDLTTEQVDTLVNFDSINGKWPYYGALIQAPNGLLYGTTAYGGANNAGVFFSYNPITDKDTVLINFIDSIGTYPYGGPVLANNGNIYGMTYSGGFENYGMLFRFNPASMKDTFFVFNTADGFFHSGSLLEDTNGFLYGMQTYGGSNNEGSLFSFNTSTGLDTQLIAFDVTNGAFPYGTPMQASNGLLYGMTSNGGASNYGTIFSYNITTEKDTALINFNGTDARNPTGDFIEAFTAIIASNDTVNCYGDSAGWAKIITRGGKTPITYLWNNGSTIDSIGNLKAGTYTCQVSDLSGTTLQVPVTIVEPQPLLANPLVENDCLGNNDSGWVSPTGGTPPYTFLWNNGYTRDTLRGMPPGLDSCHITDARGCTQLGILTFANAATLKIDSVVSTRPSCFGCSNGTATVYVSGGIPPGDSNVPGYTLLYLWTYGGDSAKVRGIPSGVDSVTVTNECGSVVGFTDVPLSINTIDMPAKEVKIYPIPSNGLLTFAMNGEGFENIIINDELGRTVYSEYLDAKLYDYTLHADLSSQPNGIYIVQLFTNEGVITRKLIIEK